MSSDLNRFLGQANWLISHPDSAGEVRETLQGLVGEIAELFTCEKCNKRQPIQRICLPCVEKRRRENESWAKFKPGDMK